MATIVWCDRKGHLVKESRATVQELLNEGREFVYLTPKPEPGPVDSTGKRINVGVPSEVALRSASITCFHAPWGEDS
jgi:hypothetical protein